MSLVYLRLDLFFGQRFEFDYMKLTVVVFAKEDVTVGGHNLLIRSEASFTTPSVYPFTGRFQMYAVHAFRDIPVICCGLGALAFLYLLDLLDLDRRTCHSLLVIWI